MESRKLWPNKGMHADVSSLKYLPMRGIEANQVTVYTDPSRERVLGSFHKLLIDVDLTKLLRKDVRINRLDLSGASISLAANPDDDGSKTLDITELKGRMDLSGNRSITVSGASGMVGGVRLAINGTVKLFRTNEQVEPEELERARAERQRTLLRIIDALDSFELESSLPPRISIDAEGDLEKPGSFRANLVITASEMRSRDLEIKRIEIHGEMRNRTLVFHKAEFDASVGQLSGNAEMEFDTRRGRFEMRSDLDITEILTNLRLPLPESIPSFDQPPTPRYSRPFPS